MYTHSKALIKSNGYQYQEYGVNELLNKERSSNVEILRIFAMFLIVLHHSVVHGILKNGVTNLYTDKQALAVVMSSGGKYGVGLFILITGYFLINKKSINWKSLMNLWAQVVTYAVIIYVVFVMLHLESFSVVGMVSSFLPIIFNKYWFVTNYVLIILFSPFVNTLVGLISRNRYRLLLTLMIGIWFIIPSVSPILFHTSLVIESNNLVLLLTYYLVGGYIRKFSSGLLSKSRIVVILLVVVTMVLGWILIYLHSENYYRLWYQAIAMNSVMVLVAAIATFLLVIRIPMRSIRTVNFLASTMFGVYLFHDNPLMRNWIWDVKLKLPSILNSDTNFIFWDLIYVSVVFVAGVIIEVIRKMVLEPVFSNLIATLLKKYGKPSVRE